MSTVKAVAGIGTQEEDKGVVAETHGRQEAGGGEEVAGIALSVRRDEGGRLQRGGSVEKLRVVKAVAESWRNQPFDSLKRFLKF